MRPSTPPPVITSSPFCSASTIVLCSLARFICGRIMRKYSSTNIRTIGRKLISPASPAPAAGACADAEGVNTCKLLKVPEKTANYITSAEAAAACAARTRVEIDQLGPLRLRDNRCQPPGEAIMGMQVPASLNTGHEGTQAGRT